MRFTGSVEGHVQLDRRLLNLETGFDDLERIGLWPEVQDEFLEIEADEFRTDGQGEWAPHSEAYAKWLEANDPFPLLMRRTQRLYLSLTRRGHADAVYEPSRDSVTLGTRVPYGRAHMGAHGRRPARPPVNMGREAYRRRMIKRIQKHLVGFIRGAGRDRRAGFVQTDYEF